MKGTEKQIAWAEDIIKSARVTVAANIAKNEEEAEKHEGSSAAAYYRERADKWKRLGEQIEGFFAATDDAAKIIDKRDLFDPRQLCNKWVDRA